MIKINLYVNRRIGICLLLVSIFLNSCTKNLQKETVVYQNNFNNNNISRINNVKQDKYSGSGVLGRYGTEGFELDLENLSMHDLVEFSFDLYIHNNWTGNSAAGVTDSADIFIIDVDKNNLLYTTFSNGLCGANCTYQSYPESFPFQNNPVFANAIKSDLPPPCNLLNGITSKYKISRTIYHSSLSFKLGCFAQLFRHRNSPDPLCEASWSIDNLTVKIIKFRD